VSRLIGTPKDKNAMAFRNVDGSVIVVAANFDKEGRTLYIKAGSDVATIFLQPESFSTVKITC